MNKQTTISNKLKPSPNKSPKSLNNSFSYIKKPPIQVRTKHPQPVFYSHIDPRKPSKLQGLNLSSRSLNILKLNNPRAMIILLMYPKNTSLSGRTTPRSYKLNHQYLLPSQMKQNLPTKQPKSSTAQLILSCTPLLRKNIQKE